MFLLEYIVVGFFWNILLVGIRYVETDLNFYLFFSLQPPSAVSLLVKWIMQNKRVSLSIFEESSSILNYNFTPSLDRLQQTRRTRPDSD